MATLAASLEENARKAFFGRERELQVLRAAMEAPRPRVIHISGVAGIGKSTLLEAFESEARERGANVLHLDCRLIEPSVPGLLGALAEAVGAGEPSLEAVVTQLAAGPNSTILALDTYELFWLMDTYIRRELCPALPDGVRVVLAGRSGPVGAWLTAPGWRGLFRALTLGPLNSRESLAYLRDAGLSAEAARRVDAIARGQPLALRMAASLADGPNTSTAADAAAGAIVDYLTREYLASATDPETRAALEAASVIRRATESILGAMLPDQPAADSMARLRALPFTETRRDGLFVHDAVRDGIATRLIVSRPERHRSLRVAAWRQLREEVRHASRASLWRYTADILYLLQKPEVREGFFPSGYQPLAVEAAQPGDLGAILATAARHESPSARSIVEAWWEHHPGAFAVCRDAQGDTAGFAIVIRGDHLSENIIAADPIAAGWREDMLRHGDGAKSLLIRRLLDLQEGEAASGSRGALGLDVKRTYMEMRPNLRFIYLGGIQPENFDWCDPLGFEAQPNLDRDLDGIRYRTYRLDMGPGSVDAWLTGLVAAELGIAPERRGNIGFDAETHELDLPQGTVTLTPLESKVMALLWERAPRPVSRADLLAHGWQGDAGASSNVVDAVVVTLRKKLGNQAAALETVRGTGYRLRSEAG